MANLNLTAGENITLEQDGNNLVVNSTGGGTASDDIIVISDTEPQTEDTKLWIDTGEVQNLGSEIHVGTEVDPSVLTNIVISKNLFDINNISNLFNYRSSYTIQNKEITITNTQANNTSSSSAFSIDYINLLGKTLTLSCIMTPNSSNVPSANLYWVNDNNEIIGSVITSLTETGSVTFTMPSSVPTNATKLAIFLYANSSSYQAQVGDYVNYKNIQIQYGTNATTFEPYITPSIICDGQEIYKKNNLEIYSTNETRIGTWINGKPLYRKVVDIGNLPNADTKNVALNISNLSQIIRMYGYAEASGVTIILPHISTFDEYQVGLQASGGNMQVVTGYDRSLFSGYVIVEYTKTTD